MHSLPFTSMRGFVLICAVAFSITTVRAGVEETGDFPDAPIDPQLAIKQFKAPDNFKVDLFAAEPQLKNPVAFTFDEQGRVFVAETFRYKTSVFDIRDHMNMYYDDLSSRTVADRAEMIRRFLGNRIGEMTNESEVIQELEDTTGSGKADHSQVYADGFNTILDGIGAGVLAHKGNIYYTDIPNLWLLQGTNSNGMAAKRTSLAYGFGVHFGYTGHDLHGLRIGPDGKLYMSTGDRALNVTNKEGRVLDYTEMGSVLRCNLDGSDLEVFAYGLRNPQDLAFDDYGNLFTGDNNCDHGDAARLVYVVEDGDSGWRIANQFSETTPAGVWNSEKLWYLQFPSQAAYIVPPIAHVGDGPSGFSYYPGTGFPDSYKGHFFLADFRGASVNSGIHTLAVEQNGAGYKMVDESHFFWHILATDVQFSPDGRMYVSDWVRGWPQSALGRLYRLYDTNLVNSPLVLETKKLISEGMDKRPVGELQNLLAHPDQRVRMAAQFELADRAMGVSATPDSGHASADALLQIALSGTNQLSRLHGIWGLGEIARSSKDFLDPILPLLNDPDAEVRAQTAKVLGDHHQEKAFAQLTNALTDASLRVRFFAAQSLGKLGNHAAVPLVIEMLRANADQDVFLRHAAIMCLAKCAESPTLVEAARDGSRSVRMAVLVAMRRRQLPEVAMFLHDPDQLIVLEAARTISDLPLAAAMPQLASLVGQPTGDFMLDWRILNANFRAGDPTNAVALANLAAETNASERLRSEALGALGGWAKPFPRDRITGLWRPLPARDASAAVSALQPVIANLLTNAPDYVRLSAITAIRQVGMTNLGANLLAVASDTNSIPSVRVAALKVLAEFGDANVSEAARMALSDEDPALRQEGRDLQAQFKPADAAGLLETVLESGTVSEKQGAFATLSTMEGDSADKMIADWLDKLIAGKVPKEVQLDLIDAAEKRSSDLVKDKLKQYEDGRPKNDEFVGFRETLYGGNAEIGRKIFLERPDASCVRCHKVHGEGGEVGPDVSGIGTRHDREYLLESIIFPNKQIAPGYESVLVEMKNGQSYAGVVKSQDDQMLNLFSIEDNALEKLKKSDIKTQIKGQSPMPEGMGAVLSKDDLRNLVEFLATVK
jgi:quinoprotein glucose dehydrogenase